MFGELLPTVRAPKHDGGSWTCPLVFPEAACRRQLHTTGGAGERAAAGHLVHPQARTGAKRPPTVTAAVWPPPAMGSELVDEDSAVVGESAAAHGTSEQRLCAAVETLVSQHGVLPAEAAGADAAAEAPPTACGILWL